MALPVQPWFGGTLVACRGIVGQKLLGMQSQHPPGFVHPT